MIKFRPQITVPKEEWTNDDDGFMKQLVEYRAFPSLRKLINRRLNTRIDSLIETEGRGTRQVIQELTDLLRELDNYANPS